MITNNKILYDVAQRNYQHFPVPTKLVESIKLKRYYTPEQQADLDIKTSVNKIGEIINLSAELLSIMWDKLNHGEKIENVMELYADIAQLDVMSNLEIDSAKRENPADNVWELKQLKKKYDKRDNKNRHVRPLFFKYIDDYKGYNNSYHVYREFGDEYEKVYDTDSYTEAYDLAREEDSLTVCKGHMDYQFMQSTMDMIDKSISKFKRGMDKRYKMCNINDEQDIPFVDCLLPISYYNINEENQYKISTLCDIIIPQYIKEKQNISKNAVYDLRHMLLLELYNKYLDKVEQLNLNVGTIRRILDLAFKGAYVNIRNEIWSLCQLVYKKYFNELILKSVGDIYLLQEYSLGLICIYDIKYRRVPA